MVYDVIFRDKKFGGKYDFLLDFNQLLVNCYAKLMFIFNLNGL